MNVGQALAHARVFLTAGGVEDASLESEILLRHALKLDRVQLYLNLDGQLSREQEVAYNELVSRRQKGEPSAYITQHREFYGLDFYVDSRVLIPRPETELLVDKALEFAQKHRIKSIADIGTGCGNIAISLAINLPHARVYATDISSDVLEVARLNCVTHKVQNIQLLQGNLLEPLPEPVDIIVSNLPYVKQTDLHKVNTSGFEPTLALDGGENGLDKITQLCKQVNGKLRPGGGLLLETGIGQKEAVVHLLQNLFPSAKIDVYKDPAGIERVVELLL